MPVDKIVDSSSVEARGRGTQSTQADTMRATMEALSNRTPGNKLGPRCCISLSQLCLQTCVPLLRSTHVAMNSLMPAPGACAQLFLGDFNLADSLLPLFPSFHGISGEPDK